MRKQLSKIAIVAALGLALAFNFSCSSDNDDDGIKPSSSSVSNIGGSPSSSSGGNPGGLPSSSSGGGSSSSVSGGEDFAKWMTYNLNYETEEGSKCYLNNSGNCTRYGKLYNWAAAMKLPQKCNTILSTSDADCRINIPHHRGLCPVGYHIPTKEEWDALITAAGGASEAGKKLKSNDYSSLNSENGTNDYGFTALPGHYGNADGTFSNQYTANARWWSASEDNATYAYGKLINASNNLNVTPTNDNKSDFSSVRCLQDYLASGNNNSSSSIGGGGSSSSNSGIGSCARANGSTCAENVSQSECRELGDDRIFSNAACNASYTYCISESDGLPVCNLIGSATVPSKASCPAYEDGVKMFAKETVCSGSKGSCIIPWAPGLDYKYCIDVNRGICDLYAESSEGTTFQSGECSIGTNIGQYPCCYFYDEIEESGEVQFFTDFFSKSDCYSRGGWPANHDVCLEFL